MLLKTRDWSVFFFDEERRGSHEKISSEGKAEFLQS
jgi:hypothetical protein